MVIGRPIRTAVAVSVRGLLGRRRLGGTVLAMGVAPRLSYMPRTRSSRVLWMLEELGAPYEITQIAAAERRSPDHLRRHPLGRVPALELGDGMTMFESAAICLQLADLYLRRG